MLLRICCCGLRSLLYFPRAQSSKKGGIPEQSGLMRFYTDDTPGIKVGPTTVLVLSLLYIGAVVLLHIGGKLTGGSRAAPAPAAE